MASSLGNIVGNFLETPFGRLDAQEENVNGFFPNITMFTLLIASLIKNRPFPITKPIFREEYDYVIVGGGSAGSVMANRLSELSCVSVLLLEAGAEAPYLTEVPASPRILYGSKIDWAYKTVPQNKCAKAHNNRQVIWNSGKALGGSSVLNAMLYVRGNKQNFDDWEAEGAEGWGYDDVLPYFKKLEENQDYKLDTYYHNTSGPITVEKPNYTPNFKNPAIAALRSLGLNETDPNGRRETGIYDIQGTLRDGFRCSTAKAYLVPAENRSNLDILKGAFATKIKIEDKVARGVEFDFEGGSHTVRALKEVIVSSGAVRTPQILMLSGIGPQSELKKFNISVVADLPVGKNLHDHITTYLPYLMDPKAGNLLLRYFNPINIYRYINDRAGPLASPCQVSLIAFLQGLNVTSSPLIDFPKIQIYFADYDTFDPKQNYNLKEEEYEKVYGPYEGKAMYACLVTILQPESRGKITLKSTNPYDDPVIDPKYYEKDEDMQYIVEGMKNCHKIATSEYLEKIKSKPFETTFSGCEEYEGDLDKQFRCFAESLSLTFWHPVGTARMGSPDDPRSVVDPKLRVIGVGGLRVVNAAIMPIITSGNTNTPTIMIAEKAADIIKEGIMCS